MYLYQYTKGTCTSRDAINTHKGFSKSRKKNSHTIYNTDKTGKIDLFSILYIVHINLKFYPNSM